jgi:hypothetical protein
LVTERKPLSAEAHTPTEKIHGVCFGLQTEDFVPLFTDLITPLEVISFRAFGFGLP